MDRNHPELPPPLTDGEILASAVGALPEHDAAIELAESDWLRTHDDDRELYLAAKRELAAREWKYVQNYADAKSAVVREIVARALAE